MTVEKITTPDTLFPTKWQRVLFHCYGFVTAERLAAVLSCAETTIEEEGARLGLILTPVDPRWLEKGYITLIRNAWFLLPREQICLLLGVTDERLAFILQNDDFLSVKLGEKPACAWVSYSPLTEEQITQTDALAHEVKKYIQPHTVQPFDFFHGKKEERGAVSYAKGTRIVHGYLSPCGDAFIEDSQAYMPDSLLEGYAAQGVNGVWLHGVLSALSPYPFNPSLSKDYPVRRKNLQELIERCAKFGIKVYLYFNEPRALPENGFGKYSHLIGHRENGYAALCFEREETREYLYAAVKDLLCGVQGLGGIITITMSENLTHCNYRPRTNCPVCKEIPPEQTAAAVNNVIQRAIKDSGSNAELIANLWGWSPFMEWTEEQTLKGVENLDRDISVMCVSEYDLEIEKGGVQGRIIDYSISNPGPSEITRKTLKKARESGHKIYAKIQVNNSWECSAVPYLPVYDLLYEHLQNLTEIGVEDYMLTWTLGGYPSPMLSLAAEYAQDTKNFSLTEWYRRTYGENAQTVQAAVLEFCKGFREYPFSIQSLYFSPKTLGAANLWSLEREEKISTMVCYAFDDYETWIAPYPVEVYLSQYEKLLSAWEKGMEILENADGLDDLKAYAKAGYSHFKTDYLQTKFSYLKREQEKNGSALRIIIEEERDNAARLLGLAYKNPCIGFEASNHYYYTDRNLIEKILSLPKNI